MKLLDLVIIPQIMRAYKILPVGLLLGFSMSQGLAAVITANSVSQAHVAAAINAAVDGDTVVIPAGIAYWTTGLTISEKAITLKGSGTNATIIVDEIPDRSTPAIKVKFTKPSGAFRLTEIQFRGGVTNTGANAFGVVVISGSDFETTNSVWRIDHCLFNRVKGRPIYVYAWSGLIDSCVFDQNGASGLAFDGRSSGSDEKGDRSWSTPVAWGTINSGVYFENCYITNSVVRAITDGFAGARFVFRYNTCYNVAAENHGTESSGRFRGTRSMEVYGNYFVATSFNEFAVLLRSGTGLIFSNTVAGKFPGLLRMANYRERSNFHPWGPADGRNPWDLNFPTLYANGAHSGTSGSTVLSTTANWSTNQWVGYHVINTNTGKSGQILSNTKNTITCYSPVIQVDQITWSYGDRFEIRKIDKALDMPGAGLGGMLYGGSTTPSVAPTPVGWPNQVAEPIRYWNNSGNTNISDSGYYTIKAGRNYTNAPLPNYKALVYPHPWVAITSDSGGRDGYVAPPSGLQVVPPQ